MVSCDGRLGFCRITGAAAARFFSCSLIRVSTGNQGGSCASGAVEVVDCVQLRFDGLAIGCKCGGRVKVDVEPSKADFRSSRQQRLLSRWSVSNAVLAQKVDGSDVFGKAVVDVLVNKGKGPMDKGQPSMQSPG